MSREKVSDSSALKQNIRPVMISVVSGIVACILILVLFSVVMATQNVPQSLVEPMVIVSICAGALVTGWVSAKMIRENGLIWGLICGIILCFVLLLASFGISDNGFGVPALFKVVFILLSSMLGGVLGVNTRRKRRR